MKTLFTAFPLYGHLLPLLPLVRAAATAGDEVVIAASKELHATADGLPVRALGPSLPDLIGENERRFGQDVMRFTTDNRDQRLLDSVVALFTTTRADMAYDELCALAADEHADLIVAEQFDYVAPLAAARLGIPWVTFVHSPADPIYAAREASQQIALEQRALTMPSSPAAVQLWPEWLDSEPAGQARRGKVPIQAVPHNTSAVADLPAFNGNGERPTVLVTFGTVVDDLALLNHAVRAVLDAGADALVTTGFTALPEDVEGAPGRVHAVPFAPIAQLLDQVQAVVAAGGSGTTLAALSRGLPLAFVPRVANQPHVASTVASFGAGIVCQDPAELGPGVETLLHTPELRERARAASDLLGQRPTPDAAWSQLRGQINLQS
jgi:UDP:flavonoid glycosyltransferase YjiC (YdhE family)